MSSLVVILIFDLFEIKEFDYFRGRLHGNCFNLLRRGDRFPLQIKNHVLVRASFWLQKHGIVVPKDKYIAIHWRRSDFALTGYFYLKQTDHVHFLR